MKRSIWSRSFAVLLAFCLFALPAASLADTYLPDGEVTHTDFSLNLSLHADGFPAGSSAHLTDWETFLQKLSVSGAMDSLAMFTPNSRVYLNGALNLNGEEQIPFVYDGYHSYRYLSSPAFNDETLFFQMHNFLEFMLKPYYYMELPTQYLALLMYPDAAYWIGDSYYTPVVETLENAKAEALASAAANTAAAVDSDASASSGTADVTADDSGTPNEAASIAIIGGADGPTGIFVANGEQPDGSITYTVPYADLYELSETLDLIVNDDNDLYRAYYFFTCLLTDLYASDMTLDMLGNLEYELEAADPDELDMVVTQSAEGMTVSIGDQVLFEKHVDGDANAFTLTLPTSEGYSVTFDYAWTPQDVGAALSATLTVALDGEDAIVLTVEGTGMPCEGDLGGEGNLTLTASGYTFTQEVQPLMFDFNWTRDAAEKPYTLDLHVDWIHPETMLPALSLDFSGTLSTVDKSVFKEGTYEQSDFFNLNETFLEEYKARLMPTMILKLAPIVLEMPAGVINDIYQFSYDTDILVSFME